MHKVWLIPLAFLVAMGVPSSPSGAQDATGILHCVNYLKNTGSFWGDPNNIRWQDTNALWLCEHNQDMSTPPAPVKCFSQQMAAGKAWEGAIISCRTSAGVPASSPNEVLAKWQRLAAQAQQQQAATQQPQNNTRAQTGGTVQAGGQQQISIAVTNGLNQPVDQFLVDPATNEYKFYYTLQPGDTIDQPSSQGLQWAYSIGGAIQSTYLTTAAANQTFVIGSAAPATQPVAPQPPAQQPPAQQPPAVARVNGTNLQMAEFSGGAFVKLGGNYWGEVTKKDWKVVFAFEEMARTAGGVRLQSPKDKKHILLNLVDNKVYYGYDHDGGPTKPIYNITNTAAQSRVPGSSIPWDAMNPPQSTLAQQVAAATPGQAPTTGSTGNSSKAAFDTSSYTLANKRCRRQDAKLGPRKSMMTQILGVCHPVKTDINEFVVNYRSEVLSYTPTIDKTRGTVLKLVNKPTWQAWIDGQGDIHVAMSTNQNSIGIENASRTKKRRGPFLRRMNITVTPGLPIEAVETFPINGMGSSFASRSTGFTVGASVGANVGHPMATGLNANLNASYSDTTTASWTLDEFRVIIKDNNQSPGQKTFSWSLCAWATLTECYKGGTDLMKTGFLGGLENELIALPNSAFRLDNFKSDVHYVINQKAHLNTLSQQYLLIQFDYNIRLETVRPWSDNGGLTRYGKTTGGNLTYTMAYHVDLRELARIVLDNPQYFDAGAVARQ